MNCPFGSSFRENGALYEKEISSYGRIGGCWTLALIAAGSTVSLYAGAAGELHWSGKKLYMKLIFIYIFSFSMIFVFNLRLQILKETGI